MGFFQKKSNKVKKSKIEPAEDSDVAVADEEKPPQLDSSSEFKMMERQEVFAPDLTSPVITALISENIEAGRRGEPGYGITDVMKLISAIPQVSDSELAMVIRTIASFGIDVKAVVKEAIEKERLAKHRIERLNSDINNHKTIIKQCKDEINLLEVGLVEMEKSKDCLIKGMRLLTETEAALPLGESKSSNAKPKTKSKRATRKKSVKTKAKTKKTKVVNTAETVELTSINLDVQPVKRGKKPR